MLADWISRVPSFDGSDFPNNPSDSPNNTDDNYKDLTYVLPPNWNQWKGIIILNLLFLSFVLSLALSLSIYIYMEQP